MPAGTAAIDRILALFGAIAQDDAVRPLSAIAAELGLPPSTAYRMAALLVRRGLIAPARRGHYRGGLALLDLAARCDPHRILADAARPMLRRLARETQATAHLGVWDGDMVTYVVKEAASGSALFTREGGQLEAYCSAIGKVLLANLEPDRQDAYLAAGPFVALTDRTVIEPERIRATLRQVVAQDHAVDEQEIANDLFCIALPVRRDNRVMAAISLSRIGSRTHIDHPPPELRRCAEAIAVQLGRPWIGSKAR